MLDLEVAQALRRYVKAEVLERGRRVVALEGLQALDVERYPHDLYLPRIWALRGNLTAYEAAYVALAEALDAPLLTRDGRLARAPGHRARVELI